MQKKINIVLFSLVFVLLFYIIISNNKIKVYSKKIKYLDNNIVINIYSKNSNLSNKALDKIEKNYNTSTDDICVVTSSANKILKNLKLKNYIINAEGNIIIGDHYNSDYYKVGLEDPNVVGGVFKIIKIKNKAIATSLNENYKINIGIRYFDSDISYKSINVISDDLVKSSKILNKIKTMNITKAKEYVDGIKEVEAIWYLNDNSIITSSGFDIYE